MTESPEGPGWSLGDDGAWHRPEPAPAPRQVDQSRPTPIPVPELPVSQYRSMTPAPVVAAADSGAPTGASSESPVGPAAQQNPSWSGESDRRPEAGPMYPDLFQQAVAGSALANVVSVNYGDGQQHETLETSSTPARMDDSHLLVSSSAHVPAEVGAFFGASAKKRWRLSHLSPHSLFPHSTTSDRASD